MQSVGVQEYRLRFSECDRYGRMKLKTFCDYAQEVAGIHASELGVGLEVLLPQQRSWFLSRICLEIDRYPVVGSRVRVTTWPAGFDGLFALREFRFALEDGGCFARGSSGWLLMDVAAMRILHAERLCGALLPPPPEGESVAFPCLGKLPVAPAEENPRLRRVMPTQIDVNGHLNNAEYAAILQDCLGLGVYPARLQINYKHSVPPDSELTISGHGSGEGDGFLFTGRLDGVVSFEAAGTLHRTEQGE
jgi:medium-chain acyl-[acyl-carrier-protein] hydrolase